MYHCINYDPVKSQPLNICMVNHCGCYLVLFYIYDGFKLSVFHFCRLSSLTVEQPNASQGPLFTKKTPSYCYKEVNSDPGASDAPLAR